MVEAERVHTLALAPDTYAAVAAGTRTFDVRLDAGYSEGDLAALWETAEGRGPTGRVQIRRIGHIAPVFQHSRGLVVILSLLAADGAATARAERRGPPALDDAE